MPFMEFRETEDGQTPRFCFKWGGGRTVCFVQNAASHPDRLDSVK